MPPSPNSARSPTKSNGAGVRLKRREQRSNLTRSREDTAEHESFRRADANGRYRETQARTPQLDHHSGRSRIPLTANAAACCEYRARRTDAGYGRAAARRQYQARRTRAGYAIAAAVT